MAGLPLRCRGIPSPATRATAPWSLEAPFRASPGPILNSRIGTASTWEHRDWLRPPPRNPPPSPCSPSARSASSATAGDGGNGPRFLQCLLEQQRGPHHSLLTYFRQRLGAARLQSALAALVRQARR